MGSAHLALVERSALVAELSAMLAGHPLVSLYGPPGSGKSYFLFGLLGEPALAHLGRPAMVCPTPLPPDDPLRRLRPGLRCEDLPAAVALGRLLEALGCAEQPPPELRPPGETWTWISDPQEQGPYRLLLLDAYDRLAPLASWLSDRALRYLGAGACRLVCAQRTPIGWGLSELDDAAGSLEMAAFAEGEVAQFVEQVLAVPSPSLAHLLTLVTAGYPLALQAWGSQVSGGPEPAAPSRGWPAWLAARREAGQAGVALLAAAAALAGGFDRAAIHALLGSGPGAELAAALGLGPPPGLPGEPEHVRALQALRSEGWLLPDELGGSERIAAPLAAALEAELRAARPGLLARIDGRLAAHYRGRVEADPFLAQADLARWLGCVAGREQLCGPEWARLRGLLDLVAERVAAVLADNPFAEISLFSDIYADQPLLAALRRRGLLGELDRQMQRLLGRLARAAAAGGPGGPRLRSGQEIRADADGPRNWLMRLPRRALQDVLSRAAISPRSWELALGRDLRADDEFSRAWFEERAPALYEALRANGLLVGRSVSQLPPSLRAMCRGDGTLVERLRQEGAASPI